MPHTDVIPTSASIASTGKGLRLVANYAYAYSGLVDVDNNETTLLDFNSGSGIIAGKFQFFYASSATHAYRYIVYFNNLEVINYRVFGSTDSNGEHQLPSSIPIVIPPLTIVKATAENIGDTSSNNQIGNLVGRVYGAE